jgi:hypothetical protein
LFDVSLVKIFSHSVSGPFKLETISLLYRSYLISCSLICQSFLLVAGVLLRKSLPIPLASRASPSFSYTTFKVLGLILRSLTHFELIRVQDANMDLVSVFCRQISSFPATFLLKRLSFLYPTLLATLSKIRWA